MKSTDRHKQTAIGKPMLTKGNIYNQITLMSTFIRRENVPYFPMSLSFTEVRGTLYSHGRLFIMLLKKTHGSKITETA